MAGQKFSMLLKLVIMGFIAIVWAIGAIVYGILNHSDHASKEGENFIMTSVGLGGASKSTRSIASLVDFKFTQWGM